MVAGWAVAPASIIGGGWAVTCVYAPEQIVAPLDPIVVIAASLAVLYAVVPPATVAGGMAS